jgi:hypothetical protein
MRGAGRAMTACAPSSTACRWSATCRPMPCRATWRPSMPSPGWTACPMAPR